MNESPFAHRIAILKDGIKHIDIVEKGIIGLVVQGDFAQYEMKEALDHTRQTRHRIHDALIDCLRKDYQWKASYNDGSEPS